MVQGGEEYTDGYVLYHIQSVTRDVIHYAELYPEGDYEVRMSSTDLFEDDITSGLLVKVEGDNGERDERV